MVGVVLPEELAGLASVHARRLGLSLDDFMARAIRAYAKAPATPAERQRSRRERQKRVVSQ